MKIEYTFQEDKGISSFVNDKKTSHKIHSPEGKLIETMRWGYYENPATAVRFEHILVNDEATPSVVRTYHENGTIECERTYNIKGFLSLILTEKHFDETGNLICERGGSCDIATLEKGKNYYIDGCKNTYTETAQGRLAQCTTVDGKLKVESTWQGDIETQKVFDVRTGKVATTYQYQNGRMISENGVPR